MDFRSTPGNKLSVLDDSIDVTQKLFLAFTLFSSIEIQVFFLGYNEQIYERDI
jgi:hypothetical protein